MSSDKSVVISCAGVGSNVKTREGTLSSREYASIRRKIAACPRWRPSNLPMETTQRRYRRVKSSNLENVSTIDQFGALTPLRSARRGIEPRPSSFIRQTRPRVSLLRLP